jgi:hypothetical protein
MCNAAEWVWNLSMIKAVLLAAGASRRVSGVLAIGVPSANPPANGKQGLVPEEMSQTLTNKKQGKKY